MKASDLAEPLAWWVVLYAGYLAIISTISATEMVVGAGVAALGAAGAVATRRALLAADNSESYRPPAGWLLRVAPLPVRILRDSALLARPRLTGGLDEIILATDRYAAARRGFATLLISTPPGSYVVQVDG